MSRVYTDKTAALKATFIDARNIDAKKMLLNGKNILDYISDSGFDSYDTRDPQLKNDELDLWNTAISLSEEGHIEVKPHVHGIKISEDNWVGVYEGITESQLETLRTAIKVIDDEILDASDEHIMYWQTKGFTSGDVLAYTSLESFDSDLSSLTNGNTMFTGCSNLTTFSSDLSSLTSADGMFRYCSNLESFTSDLSSLTDGFYMFQYCQNLTSFSSDLSSLTDGTGMFYDCSKLTSFASDLSSLTNGNGMFCFCSKLTSFASDLSSLTNGNGMFNYSKIDAPSVANIVHTLPSHESEGNIAIGIGCDNTEADKLLFAQECDCETWQELLDDFSDKNWTVTFQCNGRPTTTYNMRRGETLPVYTKLEEVTDNKKNRYTKYTSADGSKFYNIKYFHSTNGSTEGYDVFSSLEEAISTYNVTPKN